VRRGRHEQDLASSHRQLNEEVPFNINAINEDTIINLFLRDTPSSGEAPFIIPMLALLVDTKREKPNSHTFKGLKMPLAHTNCFLVVVVVGYKQRVRCISCSGGVCM